MGMRFIPLLGKGVGGLTEWQAIASGSAFKSCSR